MIIAIVIILLCGIGIYFTNKDDMKNRDYVVLSIIAGIVVGLLVSVMAYIII